MIEVAQATCRHPVSGSDVVRRFNTIMMEKLHHRPLDTQDIVTFLYSYALYKRVNSLNLSAPSWTQEVLSDPLLGTFTVHGFAENFKELACNARSIKKEDLGINFRATENNKVEILSDKEQVWPQLMQDLRSAKHSININMFGIQGDPWGKEVFELLISKAQAGVKVRVLADALGARMHWYFNKSNQDFVNYLRDNGIELILSQDDDFGGNFHFDHRKFFVIDGKLAHNTGYTIEDHMRHIHFDMSMRVQGDIVKQLQANFFASWLYFGGTMPEAQTNFSQFIKEYFPEVPQCGTSSARIVTNIPYVQHRATETYYDSIRGAQHKVRIINEFLSDNELMNIVQEKAKQGIEIEIVYPRVCEWEGYKLIAYDFFDRIKDFPNVKIYLYDGPQNHGWLHTKGVVIDDEYVNFGSNNMDELALYHNYEQNIETTDPTIAQSANEKIFDYAIGFSKRYESQPTWLRTLKTYWYKLLKKLIEPNKGA